MPSGLPLGQMAYTGHADTRLLHGCLREAEKCEMASYGVEGLRKTLPEHFHAHMLVLEEEIRASNRLLRDLVGRSQSHFARVPVILEYLNVILPCLGKTLHEIDGYIEDRSISKEIRWRKMYNQMTDEAGGIPLPQQFVLYNRFLTSVYQLLTRDTNFDLNTLDALQSRIMGLREKRGIAPPPTQAGPVTRPSMVLVPLSQEPTAHWAQQIFSLPLPSRTSLKATKKSRAFGPNLPAHQSPLKPDSTILFQRKFDNDTLTLIAYIDGVNKVPYLMLRSFHQGEEWYSLRGIHELKIHRSHTAVELKRWSQSEDTAKLWAALYFITWEEMVLFHCCFGGLKGQNAMTLEVDMDEYKVNGERRLFQAQIIDDHFKHSLIVYEDNKTKGIRLHAAVWEGELRQCPVWTAFVTHQCASPTWLVRKSKYRVWLKDVQLYVFCQQYEQHHQRKGREGAFEIEFVNGQAATRFRDVFFPSSSTTQTDSEGGPSR